MKIYFVPTMCPTKRVYVTPTESKINDVPASYNFGFIEVMLPDGKFRMLHWKELRFEI